MARGRVSGNTTSTSVDTLIRCVDYNYSGYWSASSGYWPASSGYWSARPSALCPDRLRYEQLGEAELWRGRIVRAFFWLLRAWPVA